MLVRRRDVCHQQHRQQGDGERQLFAATARGNFRTALPRLSFDNLAPLLVVQLPQLELRVSEDRALELRLVHGAEPLVFAVIAVGIAGQHDLLILDMKATLIQPNRHALARQAAFGVDVEALNADIPGAIERALVLHMT